ncbi:Nucleoid-associated protein YgaU, containings BON and LysM domains [Nostoc flagelliforme CCNUN1]|uniref:Nucleoid-associated protein YgaU, containings BON and LysM domains n=1 Tax=Nostoc flagelliforme CCNUN1 TaxID=2038116 RepID=A0A2K8STP3_9NOSO|nr:LysM peptidoglycan-binding domain-containing protein [Nostoc flagelliforme]AUB38822.1 Nucleoid-associated protein YgaU, containings BON and LysM domains [Nostoc flagelliforme CCNUN1]
MATRKFFEPRLADLELFSEISDEVQASVRGGLTHKHTVSRGDTLSGLAKVYCEDSNKWPQIYKANKNKIGSNPNLIHRGQVLTIPCVTQRIWNQINI